MLAGIDLPPWAVAAIGAAVALLLTVLLLGREVSHRELAKRARQVAGQEEVEETGEPTAVRGTGSSLTGAIARLGNVLRGTVFFSDTDVAMIERTSRAAGLDPATAVPAVIGGKMLLFVAGPVIGYVMAVQLGLGALYTGMSVLVGMAFGSFVPNWALAFAVNRHQGALRKGLPDALDLLVVCTEAGLGLESALERVAREIRDSNPSLAAEFRTLLADMRVSTDRRAALAKLGDRTGLVSFQRLGGTLSQTLRYGTPIGHALRVLATEMRDERLIRIEEKAARLPALMVLPMILFILPCLFIVLGGPAAMRILTVVSGDPS